VIEKIETLHLFLNKTEFWDYRGLLSAFEMEIREDLELIVGADMRYCRPAMGEEGV
jgi:hypothetical protein